MSFAGKMIQVPWVRKLAVFAERLIFSRPLECLLATLLRLHLKSQWRRDWVYAGDEESHFYKHRLSAFALAYDRDSGYKADGLVRGFFSSEVIREGDFVLDIGCGDGFFSTRFFAQRAKKVIAVDIEPSAIEYAKRNYANSRIEFVLLDAVHGEFPPGPFDVIVWDGAIGHFAPDTLAGMLTRIKGALADKGVFVGSESLGHEGHDHLVFFETLKDFHDLLSRYFAHVELREVEYPIGEGAARFVRREAYWRCSPSAERLDEFKWKRY